jgi:RNA-directed DNA polymerase
MACRPCGARRRGHRLAPLLANVYLHYVLPPVGRLVEATRHAAMSSSCASGDDFTVGFEHRDDADRFLCALRERFSRFGLGTAPGQDTADRVRSLRRRTSTGAGSGQAGDVHFPRLSRTPLRDRAGWAVLTSGARPSRNRCGPSSGRFMTSSGNAGISLSRTTGGGWPASCEGTAPTTPSPATMLSASFRYQVSRHWFQALRRRSQRHRLTWERMDRIATRWLPPTRVLHPYPEVRFAAITRGRSPVR